MILFMSIFLIVLGIFVIEQDPLFGAAIVIIGLFALGTVGIPNRKRR